MLVLWEGRGQQAWGVDLGVGRHERFRHSADVHMIAPVEFVAAFLVETGEGALFTICKAR